MSISVDTDLRSLLGPARNQGHRPTCLAFAATAAHEASRQGSCYLSTEYLAFYGAQRSHCNPARGLTSASVVQALEYDGQPSETVWPYSRQMPDSESWAPPPTPYTCHKARIRFSARSVSEVLEIVEHGAPVILIVSVTSAMYRPDAQGVVRPDRSDELTMCRHALLAVGSGHAEDGTYVLVRNSWGRAWGTQGHGWLPEPYVAENLNSTGFIQNVGWTT